MYQKIKACLINPKRISDYIDEKISHTIWFCIFLIILYLSPIIITVCVSNNVASNISTTLPKTFVDNNISYQIKNGELYDTLNLYEMEIADGQMYLGDSGAGFGISSIIVFNPNETLPDVSTNDLGAYLLWEFNTDHLCIYYAVAKEEASGSDIDKMGNVISTKRLLLNQTYDKLKLDNIDFTTNESNSIYALNEVINHTYRFLIVKFLPLIILIILIAGTLEYLFQTLITTAIIALFFHYMGIKFGKIFKTVILCSFPLVLFEMVSVFTGISFLTIIGNFIMLIYVMIALPNYKIQNNIPNKAFFNMNNRNKEDINSKEEDHQDEKGDDEDEL